MKKLIIIITMAVAVIAYNKGRRYSGASILEDFPPYHGTRRYQPLREQHHPCQEQSLKMQQCQSYRHRPYRQDMSSYPEQLSFKDQSMFRDYWTLNNQPFYYDGSGSSFKDTSNFKGKSSFFADETSFKDQRDENRTISGNERSFKDQYSSYQQLFRDDFRFAGLYDKSINSYNEQLRQQQAGSFGRDSEYLKYGNHGLGYVSVPSISSYRNLLPLNEETLTTMVPSMAPTTTHKPFQQSTVSFTAPAITQVHMSATSEPKMASAKASHTVTMPTVKSDTIADTATSSASIPTVSTISAVPVTAKQSSNLAHPSTVLTTKASLPVMATKSPIVSFGRHTIPPIEFQAATVTASTSPYYLSNGLKNNLQQSLLSYPIARQTKNSIKNDEQTSVLNHVLPDALINSLNNKIQSSVSNYVLPEELKGTPKDNLQSSLLNYLVQQEANRGLSFQQSSLSETVNYIPLATLVTLAEKPKIIQPSMPIATLSAVSRPLQTINYVPTMLPEAPAFVTQDSSTSSTLLPLGTILSSGLSSSIGGSQAASVFNSLPGGISGGIPASIPGNMSPGVPASIPTLNFGQNFQHVGQLRPFESTRSQPYSTGLQLQLGGFGGIDYTLRSANPVPRFTDLGIAKVGLSLPELPQHQLPTFSKNGLEQYLR